MVDKLLAYQAEDAKLKEIEQSLADNEDRKMAVVAKKYIEGVDEKLTKLDIRAAELNAAFDYSVEQQKLLQEQEKEIMVAMDSVADENEINYLIKKVEELLGKIKNLTSLAQKITDDIKVIRHEYSVIRDKNKKYQTQFKESRTKYSEFKATLKDDRESVEKKLEQLKKGIDEKLMAKYLEKRANKIYPVIYEVDSRICGCCRMELNLSEINKLNQGEVIECGNCGRLLYKKVKN